MTYNLTLREVFTEGFISLIRKEIVADVLKELKIREIMDRVKANAEAKAQANNAPTADISTFLTEEEKVETVPLVPVTMSNQVVVADSRTLIKDVPIEIYEGAAQEQSTVDIANLTAKILEKQRRVGVTAKLLENTLNYLDESGHTAVFAPIPLPVVYQPEVVDIGPTKEERDEEALKAFSQRFGASQAPPETFESKWAGTLKTMSDLDFSKRVPPRNVMPVVLPPPTYGSGGSLNGGTIPITVKTIDEIKVTETEYEDYIFPPRDPGRGTHVTELPKGADLPLYTGPGVSPMEAPKPEVFELKRLSQKWAEQHLGVKLPDTIQVSQQNLTKRNLTKEQVSFRILELINELTDLGIDYVEDTSTFIELGLDSLDCVEITMMVEEEFEIEIDDNKAENAKTFGQFTTLVWELL
jgi:acyl carrier protein